MIENPYYTPEMHGPYELYSLGDFVLEEGYTLPDCELAYATFGELSPEKDNAILVATWYSGTHQTYADVYIGPEHALNPEKYFIVVVNQIGNGLSTSPHNTGGPFARRSNCCARSPASRSCSSSSAARWGRSRHTNGWSGSRRRSSEPPR